MINITADGQKALIDEHTCWFKFMLSDTIPTIKKEYFPDNSLLDVSFMVGANSPGMYLWFNDKLSPYSDWDGKISEDIIYIGHSQCQMITRQNKARRQFLTGKGNYAAVSKATKIGLTIDDISIIKIPTKLQDAAMFESVHLNRFERKFKRRPILNSLR